MRPKKSRNMLAKYPQNVEVAWSFARTNWVDFITDIYPKELTISETIEFTSVASYLDLAFTRDENSKITAKLYEKRGAFGFHIVNFPLISSYISIWIGSTLARVRQNCVGFTRAQYHPE